MTTTVQVCAHLLNIDANRLESGKVNFCVHCHVAFNLGEEVATFPRHILVDVARTPVIVNMNDAADFGE